MPGRIFLLSPARFGGPRTTTLLRDEAVFDLALRLRAGSATLGEVYSFISGLYFRGKAAYAAAFGAPPPGLEGSLVITPGLGLLPPNTIVDLDKLRQIGGVPVDQEHPGFRDPLLHAASDLALRAGPDCEFVLLGSIATEKYTGPLLDVFQDRLLFPAEFVGRGDMSRGGLMLRSVEAAAELAYIKVSGAVRRGSRPAKLTPRKRVAP